MVALVAFGWASVAGAEILPPDTTAVSDSLSGLVRPQPQPPAPHIVEVPGPRESRVVPRKRGRFDQPVWVMLRSLVVPGWGQLHNRKWVKGAVVAGSETWLILRLIDDNQELDRLEAEVDAARDSGDLEAENAAVAAFNDRLDTFVANQWFLGGLLAYSLLDAYVDAHFRDFDIEFGPEAPPQGGSPGDSGLRIGLRWSF
jgi:hypothetical protein